jgi:hypothetical protein
MISLQGLVTVIVMLIVGGLIFWLLLWLVDYVGIPEPFHKVAKVILAVFAVIFVICVLLMLVGIQVVRW